MEKEEIAIVLDYLPYGYPLEKNMIPVVQAIGKTNFTLLQIVPRKGVKFELKEEVYIGDGKRDKVLFIKGRLPREKLTETAKTQLNEIVYENVEKEFSYKLKAFKMYKSEIMNFPHPRSIKAIESLAMLRGTESGLKKAEAFQLIRNIID